MVVRTSVLMIMLWAGAALAGCSPTPFGYVLNPLGTALAPPAGPVVITKWVTQTPVVVVVTPTVRVQTPTVAPEAEIIVDWANVRSGPGSTFSIMGAVKKGDRVRVVGIAPEGTWLRVVVPPGQVQGWITKGAVAPGGALDVLPTVVHVSPTVTKPPTLAATRVPPTATRRPTSTVTRVPTRAPTRRAVPTATPQPRLTVTIKIINQLPVPMYFRFNGPVDVTFAVPARSTYTASLAAGSYTYTSTASGYKDEFGSDYFNAGDSWDWTYSPTP